MMTTMMTMMMALTCVHPGDAVEAAEGVDTLVVCDDADATAGYKHKFSFS